MSTDAQLGTQPGRLRSVKVALGGSVSVDTIQPNLISWSSIRNIMVLHYHSNGVRCLLSTPAYVALREAFPNAHIGALVEPHHEPILRGNPDIDAIYTYDASGAVNFAKSVYDSWRHLSRNWDLAILMNDEMAFPALDRLAHLTGARFVLGSEQIATRDKNGRTPYHLLSPAWPKQRHITSRYLDILAHLGVTTDQLRPVLRPDQDEIDTARARLESEGVLDGGSLIGFYLGGSNIFNRWPISSYAELAVILRRDFDARIVVFGLPGEQKLSSALHDRLGDHFGKITLDSIRGFVTLFQCCDAVVGADSDVLQLATASGKPVLGIFGQRSPELALPPDPLIAGIQGADGKVAKVRAPQVVEALQFLLSERLGNPAFAKVAPARNGEPETFDISDAILEDYLDAVSQLEKKID